MNEKFKYPCKAQLYMEQNINLVYLQTANLLLEASEIESRVSLWDQSNLTYCCYFVLFTLNPPRNSDMSPSKNLKKHGFNIYTDIDPNRYELKSNYWFYGV